MIQVCFLDEWRLATVWVSLISGLKKHVILFYRLYWRSLHPEHTLTGHKGKMVQIYIWGWKKINDLKPVGYHLSSKFESWL